MTPLKAEVRTLLDKLEDLENLVNRSRRSNIGVSGLLESLVSTVTVLCQELAPDIPLEHLEFTRIYRALGTHNPLGPPRDVVVKFHYFRSKKESCKLPDIGRL